MTKFMLLYNGPATPPAEMDPEQVQAVMEAWGAWMGRVGDALTDMGAPTANGVAVVDDGSTGVATQINGYSIVEAESLDAAKKLVEGHPFLSEGSGKFSVEIHEVLPLPAM
ncbi:MAG: YciI family protein [Thermoleophilia bacterium]|nr:YciI family protein [Thermoleophilia bacterium]